MNKSIRSILESTYGPDKDMPEEAIYGQEKPESVVISADTVNVDATTGDEKEVVDPIVPELPEEDDEEVVEESLKAKLDSCRKARKESAKKTKAESLNKKIRSKRIMKAKKESILLEEDPTMNICPVCGGKEYDPASTLCPICGSTSTEYLVKDAADVDADEFSTIEIEGDPKVLVDQDGKTYTDDPDIVNDVLEPDTHKIVIDPTDKKDGTIQVDSGVATLTDEDSPVNESESPEDYDEENSNKIAFLKIDQPINDIKDLMIEDNADKVKVIPDDNGVVLSTTIKPAEVGDGEEVEEVTESVDGEQVENVNNTYVEDINLEETPEGTLIHIDGVDNVPELVDKVNYLLPEDAQVEVNKDHEESKTESFGVHRGVSFITRKGITESCKVTVVRKVEAMTTLAGKDRKAVDKGSIGTDYSETNMKDMSVLENRNSIKESAKLRKALCALGVDPKKLESDEGVQACKELVQICGNIKDYKSNVKVDKDGTTLTMESLKAIRKRKKK